MRKLFTVATVATAATVLLGCPKKQPSIAPVPVADSASIRARADSLAAVHRRDSISALGRADSLARARMDSISRAADAHRADSVRAQILRDSADAASAMPSGLDRVADSIIAAPLHFDLDHSELSPEAQQQLEYKLNILRAHARLELKIEGHCDERGPDEYNLALGERRAAAVKRYLVEHGIADARLTIISYGEERPVDPRSNEEAWAKNRRAEFRVTKSAR
ncbi:MAG TPA: peptidoglycan-associated lipoprotein Pal [Gemmatimonadales bacterium]|jgi:peptidoglycan-associated lipoprotein